MKRILGLILFSIYSLEQILSDDCEKATKNYYLEKSFSPCRNFMSGHNLYFTSECPINTPRLCIEPTPPGFIPFQNQRTEKNAAVAVQSKRSYFDADDSRITFTNMTAVRNRINNRAPVSQSLYSISMDCLKCWDYDKQRELWSKYVDNIEKIVGYSFLNGGIRTVLEFGCGTGGFLAEMASRGVNGVCTARDTPNEDGNLPELPYLGTVASRGLIGMHISITEHQPFVSNSFGFIHCSWVLAYVNAIPEVYAPIMLEWDRLLTPGGLVVVQGIWSKGKDNFYMTKLYTFTKYLLEKVLAWKLLTWEVTEQKRLGLVLSFVALTPIQRDSIDWSSDKFLKEECPKCFVVGRKKRRIHYTTI